MSDDTNATFKTLFEQLGKQIGLDGLSPDEDGYVSLQTEAGTPVHCQIEDQRLMLVAIVGRLPSDDQQRQATIMKQLLAANALWEGTSGATLAAEPTSDQVLLQQRWTLAELEQAGLQPPFESFLGITAHWTDVLKPGSDHPAAHPDDIVGRHRLA